MDQANYYGWNIDHGYITSDKNVFFNSAVEQPKLMVTLMTNDTNKKMYKNIISIIYYFQLVQVMVAYVEQLILKILIKMYLKYKQTKRYKQ